MNRVFRIIDKFRVGYSKIILRNFWSHWFNPLYTLYFNFIFFPFRQALRLPVFVFGWPRLYAQYGTMECVDRCKTGMVRLNVTIPGGPQYAAGHTQLNIWGKVIFRGYTRIGTGNRINVGRYGVLDMGNDSKIMNFCNITAYTRVTIGQHTRIVHRCQVMDSNYHYIADFNKRVIPNYSKPIQIGDYCWICNSTTIAGGAVLPDRTIVASNSLVSKDMSSIPADSLIGGIPAKLIGSGYRRVESEKLNKKLWHYFHDNPTERFYPLPPEADKTCCDVDES